jgi:hypothetical protein
VIVAPPRTARPPAAGNGDVRWFAWNGQTYDSLSKVAFAITGTTKTSVEDEIAHLRGQDPGLSQPLCVPKTLFELMP